VCGKQRGRRVPSTPGLTRLNGQIVASTACDESKLVPGNGVNAGEYSLLVGPR